MTTFLPPLIHALNICIVGNFSRLCYQNYSFYHQSVKQFQFLLYVSAI